MRAGGARGHRGGLTALPSTQVCPPPATQFGQVLVHLDTTQQEIAGALKDNAVLLAEVGLPGPPPSPPAPGSPPAPPSAHPLLPPQVQKTMKDNLSIVEDNFADIDARIKRLQK